ncbi:MAG TPA: alkaline phosphatase family protein [Terriglobales bacterium]|jgi:phospholipase C|nr:alkaline phosphatase family protein [Terriglobales bacterium]
MKTAAKALVFLIALAATAPAQTIQPGTFKHIIIVVQENRTPDNLFGSSGYPCPMEVPFEPGVDIVDGGYGYFPTSNNQLQYGPICNTALPLSAWDPNLAKPKVIDPDHAHTGWATDFNGGNQDGFCHEYENYSVYGSTCPSYSFVDKSDVQPYLAIATNYGWANYMFQTNEGPSFPAHQFLFTGTSAPVAPKDSNNYYLDFVAENPNFNDSGCPQGFQQSGVPAWVGPTGNEFTMPFDECYAHDSLVTAAADCTSNDCDRGFSWTYYTPTMGIIWDAPAGIPEVCYQENDVNNAGKVCGTVNGGQEWANHVRLPDQNGYSDAPIFDDLFKCKLAAISWVIPDSQWSDHPQDGAKTQPTVYGPSWVGDIVDAVGNGMTGSTCNPPSTTNAKYWVQEPTLILIVWDDWGGWFDHVPPIAALQENPQTGYKSCDPTSQWGCGYTSGFRVPLLVVSPYTGTPSASSTYTGYISGPCVGNNCNNNKFPYQHDFGSILRFTEYNFGMPYIASPSYADYNAPDNQQGNVPLSDFFPLTTARPFVSIPTPKAFTCFQHFAKCTGATTYVPTGPDDDNEAD